MVYFIRHLNGNITGVSLAELGDDRPEKVYKGNGEPLNILVMGSDSRDCDGCGIDQEGGGGSDTTILVHLSADRERAYAVSIPRDSIIDRPECNDGDSAGRDRGDVERRLLGRRPGVHRGAARGDHRHLRRPLRGRGLQRLRRHGRRRRRRSRSAFRRTSSTSPTPSSCRRATRRCSAVTRPSTTCGPATSASWIAAERHLPDPAAAGVHRRARPPGEVGRHADPARQGRQLPRRRHQVPHDRRPSSTP